MLLMAALTCLIFPPNSSGPFDAPPLEKKYKPLNMPSNSAKEIKVKIIPAQRKFERLRREVCVFKETTWCSPLSRVLSTAMECTGFLDALNSAPVPGIKIKKKKSGGGTPPNVKAVSPTSNKVLTDLSLLRRLKLTDEVTDCEFESKLRLVPFLSSGESV